VAHNSPKQAKRSKTRTLVAPAQSGSHHRLTGAARLRLDASAAIASDKDLTVLAHCPSKPRHYVHRLTVQEIVLLQSANLLGRDLIAPNGAGMAGSIDVAYGVEVSEPILQQCGNRADRFVVAD
jgi:hypothetical protein